jgi:hypothetical protein
MNVSAMENEADSSDRNVADRGKMADSYVFLLKKLMCNLNSGCTFFIRKAGL